MVHSSRKGRKNWAVQQATFAHGNDIEMGMTGPLVTPGSRVTLELGELKNKWVCYVGC